MSDNVQMWAVCQYGALTKDSDIVQFATRANHRVPAILFVHQDREKCVRKRKRMITLANRYAGFHSGGEATDKLCTPILGVIGLELTATKKRVRVPSADSPNGSAATVAESSVPTHSKSGRKRSVVSGGEVPLPA